MGAAAKGRRPAPVRSLRIPRPGRRTAAEALLLVALVGVVAAGSWGIFVDRGESGSSEAAIGEVVKVPGGALRVDRATYEGSMAMPTSGPLAVNMPMSSAPGTALPEPRKGYSRLDVDVTLHAQTSAGLRFRPASFLVEAPGGKLYTPIGADKGPSRLPGGTAVSRIVVFDVPSSARNLVLKARGAARPIRLSLEPPPKGGHHP